MHDPGPPHPNHSILLLEDEPVSAEFLRAALAPLGLTVCQAGSLKQARELIGQRRFSLLLLDLRLPDGCGIELLKELRVNPDSASHGTPALALTAELDEARRAELRIAGFADALAKPITASALRDAVSGTLTNPATPAFAEAAGITGASAVWDDAAALAACGGSNEVLAALRGLFLKELPGQCASVRGSLQAGRGSESLDELHRLLAGCGFCGANDLANSARGLMQRVREAGDLEESIVRFEAAVARVLDSRLGD